MIFDTLKPDKGAGRSLFARAGRGGETLVTSTETTVATKSDIVLLRADIADLRAEMIKWIVGVIVLNLSSTAGLVLARTRAMAR